jgi:hypothetical protein
MKALKAVAVLGTLGVLLVSVAVGASAGTTSVSCTRADGKVVLKIRANSHASRGLHRAMEASEIAQHKLGVTCSDTSDDAVVHRRVTLACTNISGDEVLN